MMLLFSCITTVLQKYAFGDISPEISIKYASEISLSVK